MQELRLTESASHSLSERIITVSDGSTGSRSAPFPLIPVAALLVAMVSIQSGASLAKSLFPIVGAEGATALRLGLAAGILLIIFRPWRTRLDRAAIRPLLFYGAALGGMNLLFYLAIHSLPLAVAVALEFTGPLGLALWQSRRPIDLCWVVLAFIGIALLFTYGTTGMGLNAGGVTFALGAGVCWAVYIRIGKRAAAQGRQAAVAYGTTIAAILTVPVGLEHTGGHLLSFDILPLALAVALLTSAIPYSLEIVALQGLSTRTFGILTSMEPALAALSAAIILAEHLSLAQVIGTGTIMAASIGAVTSDSRSTPEPV
ncbi:EamA family transporter [Sphingomonas histidinilytica]|nr:EamA family protein [Sphingobium sp. TKS]MBO9378766.1 EamA family transporter [Rhizorhabdus histidinilytica]